MIIKDLEIYIVINGENPNYANIGGLNYLSTFMSTNYKTN